MWINKLCAAGNLLGGTFDDIHSFFVVFRLHCALRQCEAAVDTAVEVKALHDCCRARPAEEEPFLEVILCSDSLPLVCSEYVYSTTAIAS